MMDKTEHRGFQAPDETREFPHGRAEIIKVGGGEEPVVTVDWFGVGSYARQP